ncbi:MAG: outer membrane protein assembly factor BamB [Steroidobacteraceae bacterium]
MKKLLAALAALAVLAACSDSKKGQEPPAELVDIKSQLIIKREWSESLSGKADHLRLALRPEVVDDVVYAGGHKGEVVALNAATGRRLWKVNTKMPLSSGPGVGDGVVVFGSSDGNVVALDAATGAERWRHAVSSEVLARPLVAEGMAVVRTVDGRLQSLSLTDASQRWAVQEAVPPLSLRGTAPAVRVGEAAIAGFDNGRVLAVDLKSGETLWSTLVSPPQGRTELERLVDLDSDIKAAGDDVFVVGFQGRAAMLARESGQIWWAKDISSYRGFGMDDDNLYITNAAGGVVAFKRRDGGPVWEQLTALRLRGLTAPQVDGNAVVVGDFEGYLHWLDKSTGAIIARVKTGGDRITNAPVVAGGRVYVQTDAGKLVAYKSAPRG